MVILCRRFGITFRSHLQGSSCKDGTDRFSQNVGTNLPLYAARCRRRTRIWEIKVVQVCCSCAYYRWSCHYVENFKLVEYSKSRASGEHELRILTGGTCFGSRSHDRDWSVSPEYLSVCALNFERDTRPWSGRTILIRQNEKWHDQVIMARYLNKDSQPARWLIGIIDN